MVSQVPSLFTDPPVPVVPDITDEMQRVQRIETRVDTIERFSCLSSSGCDSQGRRRDASRWEFNYIGLLDGSIMNSRAIVSREGRDGVRAIRVGEASHDRVSGRVYGPNFKKARFQHYVFEA